MALSNYEKIKSVLYTDLGMHELHLKVAEDEIDRTIKRMNNIKDIMSSDYKKLKTKLNKLQEDRNIVKLLLDFKRQKGLV